MVFFHLVNGVCQRSDDMRVKRFLFFLIFQMRQYLMKGNFTYPGKKGIPILKLIKGLNGDHANIMQNIFRFGMVSHTGKDIPVQGSPVLQEQSCSNRKVIINIHFTDSSNKVTGRSLRIINEKEATRIRQNIFQIFEIVSL
tara:strand:- start:325715 stop:326137 length:423 start_codon:yes stop_codon:yes gene_type:complete